MSKIWAVSRGDYSDYEVQAVFEREEDAEAAVEDGYGEYVEEFRLFRAGERPVKARYWRAQNYPWNRADPWGVTVGEVVVFDEDVPKHRYGDDQSQTGVRCFWAESTDMERAVKSVADRIFRHRSLHDGDDASA